MHLVLFGLDPKQVVSFEELLIGSEIFVRDTKERLGIKAVGREVIESQGTYELREPEVPYRANFDAENGDLRQGNEFYWEISD